MDVEAIALKRYRHRSWNDRPAIEAVEEWRD
jgi:hypothetical protein